MSREQQALVIGFFLMQSIAASAAPVTRTTAADVSLFTGASYSSYTFSFDPIADATELLSVSAGSVGGFPESGGYIFSVRVNYTDNTSATIFSQYLPLDPLQPLAPLLSNLTFAKGTINGLTFSYLNNFILPKDTVFTFEAGSTVPEPSGLALFGAAGLAAWLAARRRERPQAA